ncbi:MAG: DNA polymerase III subunit delta, partial [Pseudomonadota bacterium]
MVAVKANQADAFLKKLPADVALIVAFGTDPGRVSEVAGMAAKAAAARSDPLAEVLRIDDADLEDAPDRLMVELNTVPMFGGAKVIRTTLGRRVTAASLKPLLDGPPPPATLVVEAGNLKPTDALRKSADKLAWAASLACYADTDRSVADLITRIVSDAGQTIAPDARDNARSAPRRAMSASR